MKYRPLPAQTIATILPSPIVFISLIKQRLSVIRMPESRVAIRVLKTKRQLVYGDSRRRADEKWKAGAVIGIRTG